MPHTFLPEFTQEGKADRRSCQASAVLTPSQDMPSIPSIDTSKQIG